MVRVGHNGRDGGDTLVAGGHNGIDRKDIMVSGVHNSRALTNGLREAIMVGRT